MDDMNESGLQKTDVYRRVDSILCEVLQVEINSNENTNLLRQSTEEWDSVNHLRLALELEEEFNISLAEDEWAGVASLDEVKAIITKCVAGLTQ